MKSFLFNDNCGRDNEKMYKIETHTHTSETSPCSHINASELITEYKKKGYSTVIITDHFVEKNFLGLSQSEVQSHFLKGFNAALLCGKELGVGVLLGTEIRFTNSKEDYLVYGINRDFVYTNFDIYKKDIRYLRDVLVEGGEPFLIVQAHPGRHGHDCKYSEYIDGIEVFNAMNYSEDMNDRAKDYCKQFNKLPFSGTDCHNKEVLGVAGMNCNSPVTSTRDFVEMVLNRQYELIHPHDGSPVL